MPEPAHGEPLRSRQRRPLGKAARHANAIHIRSAENARGVEMPWPDLGHADIPRVRVLSRQRQHGVVEIRALAPIQRRVGMEDLQAAHQQER